MWIFFIFTILFSNIFIEVFMYHTSYFFTWNFSKSSKDLKRKNAGIKYNWIKPHQYKYVEVKDFDCD